MFKQITVTSVKRIKKMVEIKVRFSMNQRVYMQRKSVLMRHQISLICVKNQEKVKASLKGVYVVNID